MLSPQSRPKLHLPPMKRSDSFLERDGNAAIRTQSNLISFDFRDQSARHIMPVTGMASHTGICFGQTDARTIKRIDYANVNAIGADDFHSRPHAFNP